MVMGFGSSGVLAQPTTSSDNTLTMNGTDGFMGNFKSIGPFMAGKGVNSSYFLGNISCIVAQLAKVWHHALGYCSSG